MCEICDIQDQNPEISPEVIGQIIRAVEEHEKAHLDHTVVSIMAALGVTEVTITSEIARKAADDLEYEGVTLQEKVASNWSSMTYVVTPANERPQMPTEMGLPPLKPGEVSPNNDIAALFKAIGLEF